MINRNMGTAIAAKYFDPLSNIDRALPGSFRPCISLANGKRTQDPLLRRPPTALTSFAGTTKSVTAAGPRKALTTNRTMY
jgi:hypothetical protein